MDIIVIVIMVLFAYYGMRRGLVSTFFSIFHQVFTIILVNAFNPFVSTYIRSSELGAIINQYITKTIGTYFSGGTPLKIENPFETLPLPQSIKTSMFEHNNPEVYKILEADSITAYISGYVTNIVINTLSAVLLFAIISITLRYITRTMKIVKRIPVLREFNALGGAVVGLAQGILFIWMIFVVMTLCFVQGSEAIFAELSKSTIALALYNSNILLHFVLNVFS